MEYKILTETMQRRIKDELTTQHKEDLLALETGHYRDTIRLAIAASILADAVDGSPEALAATETAALLSAEQTNFEDKRATILKEHDLATAAIDAVATVALVDVTPPVDPVVDPIVDPIVEDPIP